MGLERGAHCSLQITAAPSHAADLEAATISPGSSRATEGLAQ